MYFVDTTSASEIQKPGAYLLGIGYDGSTSYRPGTRFAPEYIRLASNNLESYSPYLDKDLHDYSIFDLGDLPTYPTRFDLIQQEFSNLTQHISLVNQQVKLLTVGGEHSISYMPIKKYLEEYPELTILHLDAHADLREEYLGNPHSHACIIRRITEHMGEGHQLIQYGIRSGTKEEFQWMRQHKTRMHSLNECLNNLIELSCSTPVYLTLDLDFFDPSELPGTGTPEAGGESFHSFVKILKILNSKNLVGADVTELSPPIDPSGNSNCFAAKIVRELLLALS